MYRMLVTDWKVALQCVSDDDGQGRYKIGEL